MFKLGLEKAEEPEMKLPTSIGPSVKQESSRKTSTSAVLTHKVKQHCKKAEVKPELRFCSQTDNDISLQPGIISVSPQSYNMKSHPWSGHTAWDPFPIRTPDCC